MVLQVVVYRVADGLPLTGSTDIDRHPEVKYCQKYLKLLSRRLRMLPDRCVLHLEGFNIYFISSNVLSFLALCDASYPTLLAFSFLEEIQKEFLLAYDAQKVNTVKRPYGLIEFEIYLQKVKQRYQNTRSLTTKLNLSQTSTELHLRPPYVVQSEDLGLRDNSVYTPNKETHRPTVIPSRRLMPVSWIGMISIFLNIFCMALNFTRGMTIISHGHFDDDDAGAYSFGSTFIVAGFTCAYQVFLIFYFTSWRRLKTLLTVCLLCWCCFYLQQFRDNPQIGFHVGVALFSAVVIITRKPTEKLPGYTV